MSKCYYRAGKNKKGKYESCATVVARDKSRDVFREKLKNDEHFRTVVRAWVGEPARQGAEPAACTDAKRMEKDALVKNLGQVLIWEELSLGALREVPF